MFVIPSTLSDDPSIIPASPDPAHPETPIACIGRQCRSARPPKLPASSFEVARPVPPSFNRPRNKAGVLLCSSSNMHGVLDGFTAISALLSLVLMRAPNTFKSKLAGANAKLENPPLFHAGLLLANPGPAMTYKLYASSFANTIGEDKIFLTVAKVVAYCSPKLVEDP
ncbi:hypothetical protein JHK85_056609 [Glycine max]|nr:hypothetical protein JHK85_056609 [Glycine max]